ncbi:MAG: preprotein translocase subunit SecE [bacterium]
MAKKNKISLSRLSRFPGMVTNFIREARDELKKVSWPSRQTTLRYTVIVIIACLITGFVIGGVDYLFSLSLERVI